MKHSEYQQRRADQGRDQGDQQGPKAQPDNDLMFYTRMLDGEECLCGREKMRKNSFCYPCFKALPVEMQRALYRGFRRGYEQAVDAAVVWLQGNKWE